MPTQKTIDIFTFDELSDSAKETARQWYRDCRDSNDLEHVIDDAVTVLELFGFTLRTREVTLYGGGKRQDPCIYWSLGYTQSDGAGFEASYSYKAGFRKAVYAYAPQDETLHRLADDLQAAQKDCAYSLTASVRGDERSRTIESDFDGKSYDYNNIGAQTVFREVVDGLNRWIYEQLRNEDEYQSADEQVDDNINANEYTFTEDGVREDV